MSIHTDNFAISLIHGLMLLLKLQMSLLILIAIAKYLQENRNQPQLQE